MRPFRDKRLDTTLESVRREVDFMFEAGIKEIQKLSEDVSPYIDLLFRINLGLLRAPVQITLNKTQSKVQGVCPCKDDCSCFWNFHSSA